VILLHYKFSISICYLKVWKFVMIQIRVPAIYFLLQTELVVASHHEGHQKTLLLLRRVVHSWDTLVASKSLWWLLLRRVVPIICDRSYRIGCNASLSLLPRTRSSGYRYELVSTHDCPSLLQDLGRTTHVCCSV
jgi:hypothetical protein